MRGVMVTLAKVMNFEQLNRMLIEAAKACEKDPSKENKHYLAGMSIMMGIHLNTEGREIGDVVRDMENSAQLFQAFKSHQ